MACGRCGGRVLWLAGVVGGVGCLLGLLHGWLCIIAARDDPSCRILVVRVRNMQLLCTCGHFDSHLPPPHCIPGAVTKKQFPRLGGCGNKKSKATRMCQVTNSGVDIHFSTQLVIHIVIYVSSFTPGLIRSSTTLSNSGPKDIYSV